MTRNDFLRLAQEAGAELQCDTICVNGKDADDLMMRFADLVAAAATETRKQLIEALVGHPLTASKADDICERAGYAVTGVVLTLPDGRACIVNRSAVRWLHGERDLFNLIHTDSALNQRMISDAVAATRNACAKVCEDIGKSRHGAGREDSEAFDCADEILALGELAVEISETPFHANEIDRLSGESKYWREIAAGYAQELSGYKNDYPHPIAINGVELDVLEQAVKEGYQTTAATQLDMIALIRRIFTPKTITPAPERRENGWYWVRKEEWGGDYGEWMPALWLAEHKSWRSASFSGIPDSEMIVGGKIVPPKAQARGKELE